MTRRQLVSSLVISLYQPNLEAEEHRNNLWNSIGQDLGVSNEQFAILFKWLKSHETDSNPPLDAQVFEAINILESRTDSISRKLRRMRKVLGGA